MRFIIFGQFISYYIYLWNLNAKDVWKKINIVVRIILLVTPIVAFTALIHDLPAFIDTFWRNEEIPLWLVLFGSAGQVIFTLRFIYQWYFSYRHHQSSLPIGFWAISLIGSTLIVLYGLIRLDPVLILGQSVGMIAYIRNIVIGYKAAANESSIPSTDK